MVKINIARRDGLIKFEINIRSVAADFGDRGGVYILSRRF